MKVVPQRKEQFPKLDLDAWGLLPAALDVWQGMVFVHPDPAAPSLHSYLGALAESMGSFRPGPAHAGRARPDRRPLQLEAVRREPRRRVPPLVPPRADARRLRPHEVRPREPRRPLDQLRAAPRRRVRRGAPRSRNDADPAPRRARPRGHQCPSRLSQPHVRDVAAVLRDLPRRTRSRPTGRSSISASGPNPEPTPRPCSSPSTPSSRRTSRPARPCSSGCVRRPSRWGRSHRATSTPSPCSTTGCSRPWPTRRDPGAAPGPLRGRVAARLHRAGRRRSRRAVRRPLAPGALRLRGRPDPPPSRRRPGRVRREHDVDEPALDMAPLPRPRAVRPRRRGRRVAGRRPRRARGDVPERRAHDLRGGLAARTGRGVADHGADPRPRPRERTQLAGSGRGPRDRDGH